jgi:hypothetical protein
MRTNGYQSFADNLSLPLLMMYVYNINTNVYFQ